MPNNENSIGVDKHFIQHGMQALIDGREAKIRQISRKFET